MSEQTVAAWQQQAIEAFEKAGLVADAHMGSVYARRTPGSRVFFEVDRGWAGRHFFYTRKGEEGLPGTLRTIGRIVNTYVPDERVVTFKRLKEGGYNWPAIVAKALAWMDEGERVAQAKDAAKVAMDCGQQLADRVREAVQARLRGVPVGVSVTPQPGRALVEVSLSFTITPEDDIEAVAEHVEATYAMKRRTFHD